MRKKARVRKVNIYLTEIEVNSLWNLARKKNLTFAEMVRRALDAFLDGQQEK